MPKSPYLLLLLIISVPLHAQDVIHRCIGSDGHPVFTDQPCAALNATPSISAPTPAAASSVTGGLHNPPPVLCAATREALRQSVTEAFATRDPNRMAALMLWNGYGKQSVVTQIQDLGQLMRRPLIGIGNVDEDTPASAGSNAIPPPREDDDLVVRTASNDGSGAAHETHFAITRRSGCLWLKP
jgi:hypothetical protein